MCILQYAVFDAAALLAAVTGIPVCPHVSVAGPTFGFHPDSGELSSLHYMDAPGLIVRSHLAVSVSQV